MGALWMLLAGVMFATMGVFAKFAAPTFSSAELVFYRPLFGMLAMGGFAVWRGWPLGTSHWRLHLTRGTAGVISLGLYFYCIAHLPLATAVTLNYTSPLFLAVITAVMFRERFGRMLLASLAVAFAGVVLLLEPTLREDQFRFGLMGLASGLLAAFAYANVKRLGATGEPSWRVVFYFTALSTAAGGLWMIVAGASPVTPANGWMLLGLGGTATVGQFAMTRAYLTGNTLVVGTLSYSTVIFSTFFGLVLWGESLAAAAWVGIALIVAGGMISVPASRRAGR